MYYHEIQFISQNLYTCPKMQANSKVLVIAQRLHDARLASGIMHRYFLLVTRDTPKQPSSNRHFRQYNNSAKLHLAYSNQGAYQIRLTSVSLLNRLQGRISKTAGCSLTSYPGLKIFVSIISSLVIPRTKICSQMIFERDILQNCLEKIVFMLFYNITVTIQFQKIQIYYSFACNLGSFWRPRSGG